MDRHAPSKRIYAGSSPVGCAYDFVAKLAKALDCKSRIMGSSPIEVFIL